MDLDEEKLKNFIDEIEYRIKKIDALKDAL